MIRVLYICLFTLLTNLGWSQKAFLTTQQKSVQLGEVIQLELHLQDIALANIKAINWSTLDTFTCKTSDTTFVSNEIELLKNKHLTGDDALWESDEIIDIQPTKNEIIIPFNLIAWEHFFCPLQGPTIVLFSGGTVQSNTVPVLDLKSPLDSLITPLKLGRPFTQIVDSTAFDKAPLFETIPVQFNFIDYFKRFGLLLLIPIVGWIIFRIMKRKKIVTPAEDTEVEKPPKPIIPAHIIALEALQNLQKNRLWEKSDDKVFVTELTSIIRNYVDRRYQVQANEMITSEIVTALQNSITPEQIQMLQNTLNVSDMIKFAKAKAGESEYETFVQDAIHFVEQTKKEQA